MHMETGIDSLIYIKENQRTVIPLYSYMVMRTCLILLLICEHWLWHSTLLDANEHNF